MNPEPRRLRKAPGPAEKALAVLGAQVSGILLRLQRLHERYGAQLTPAEQIWLRLTCSEVERYLAMLDLQKGGFCEQVGKVNDDVASSAACAQHRVALRRWQCSLVLTSAPPP